jgi:multidrug resistance efflux pump
MPDVQFRKQALARLSSPERLDELIKVVEPRTWLALGALVAIVLAAVAWSVVDRLPQRTTSTVALVAPDSIREVHAPATGVVTAVRVQDGDQVTQGEALARIQGPDGVTTLDAPVSGTVAEVAVRDGAPVPAGGQAVRIVAADQQPLRAHAYLQPGAAAALRPGLEARVSPITVPQERFGYLRGRVSYVGELPQSPEGIAATVEDAGIAQVLARGAQGVPIEVRIDLERARTPSGYAWTRGSGPPFPVHDGTLGEVAVTTGERRPIDFLLPGT